MGFAFYLWSLFRTRVIIIINNINNVVYKEMKRILITHEAQTVRQARQSNVMSIKVKKKTGACLL